MLTFLAIATSVNIVVMSLTKEILRITARRYPLGYGQLYDYLYGKNGRLNENSLRSILSRMKKDGLLRNKDRKWSITTEGEELLARRNTDIKRFFPRQKLVTRSKEKKLIVIFDIPEKKKRHREWLRSELRGLGFDLIQKSVWLGPKIPKEFVEYLSEIRILKYIRFFRATKEDLI
jgi:DNA-binding transcriptional regulator PaaX